MYIVLDYYHACRRYYALNEKKQKALPIWATKCFECIKYSIEIRLTSFVLLTILVVGPYNIYSLLEFKQRKKRKKKTCKRTSLTFEYYQSRPLGKELSTKAVISVVVIRWVRKTKHSRCVSHRTNETNEKRTCLNHESSRILCKTIENTIFIRIPHHKGIASRHANFRKL